jgi:hypothetical protein
LGIDPAAQLPHPAGAPAPAMPGAGLLKEIL